MTSRNGGRLDGAIRPIHHDTRWFESPHRWGGSHQPVVHGHENGCYAEACGFREDGCDRARVLPGIMANFKVQNALRQASQPGLRPASRGAGGPSFRATIGGFWNRPLPRSLGTPIATILPEGFPSLPHPPPPSCPPNRAETPWFLRFLSPLVATGA